MLAITSETFTGTNMNKVKIPRYICIEGIYQLFCLYKIKNTVLVRNLFGVEKAVRPRLQMQGSLSTIIINVHEHQRRQQVFCLSGLYYLGGNLFVFSFYKFCCTSPPQL